MTKDDSSYIVVSYKATAVDYKSVAAGGENVRREQAESVATTSDLAFCIANSSSKIYNRH